MIAWGRWHVSACALGLALTPLSPSLGQQIGGEPQSGVAIFWNAAQCTGGYRLDAYSAHCQPGPAAVILRLQHKGAIFLRGQRVRRHPMGDSG